MITLVRLFLLPRSNFPQGRHTRTSFLMTLCCLLISCGGSGSGGESTTNNCGISDCGPQAHISPPAITAYAGQTVELNGSGSTPNGSLIYRWQQIDGLAVEVKNARDAIANFVAPTLDKEQSLTFKLVVSKGNSDSSTEVAVIVKPLKLTASASTTVAVVGQPVYLQVDGGDSGNDQQYLWEQVDDSGVVVAINNANSAKANFTTQVVVGSVSAKFRITLTNKFGATARAEVNVDLEKGILPAITALTPSRLMAGEEIKISGSGLSKVSSIEIYDDQGVKKIENFEVVSDHEIRVASPVVRSGKYRLKLNGSGGSSLENLEFSEPLRDVKKIVSGSSHYCAIVKNGVRCWGANNMGMLGNGATSASASPVDVLDNVNQVLVGIDDIVAGKLHTCALQWGKSMWCWGGNVVGQIGDGTWLTRTSAVPVNLDALGNSNIQHIYAGGYWSGLLTESQEFYFWGGPSDLTLRDLAASNKPISGHFDSPPNPTIVNVGFGYFHYCYVVGAEKKVYCRSMTGRSDGTGSIADGMGPSSVSALALGGAHTCALTERGSVQCWGVNSAGQLGDGTKISKMSPTNVLSLAETGMLTGVRSIAAAQVQVGSDGNSSCAVLDDGHVACWGENSYGQVGDGTTIDRAAPVQVKNLEKATSITLASSSSCAVIEDGTIRCWGVSDTGELGRSERDMGSRPITVESKNDFFAVAITAGGDGPRSEFNCALASNGVMYCWGQNDVGQLGNGTKKNSATPIPVGLTGVTAISAGAAHSCAITDGKVFCWGDGTSGQLGPALLTENSSSATPIEVKGLPNILQISAGGAHTCALSDVGEVWCWGKSVGVNQDWAVGLPPFKVAFPDQNDPVVQLAAGSAHTCAVVQSGAIYCWGINRNGQLGNGSYEDNFLPEKVELPEGARATNVSAGSSHSCAVLNVGRMYCWGSNADGEVDSSLAGSPIPLEISVPPNASSVQVAGTSPYGNFSCALMPADNGSVSCWGSNKAGQLGNGPGRESQSPSIIKGLNGIKQLASRGTHSCALYRDGYVTCWGGFFGGQLGQAPLSPRAVLQ